MSNVYELPEPLARALTVIWTPPKPGRIGVTSLIGSPLPRILSIRHAAEIDNDISENFWSLLGKAVHYIIERSGPHTDIKIEHKVGGATLVGVIDYVENGHLIDWKLTSEWGAVFAADKDWENQVQTYAYLAKKQSGVPIKKLSVYILMRDWNKRAARRSADHPQLFFKQLSFEPWSDEVIERYINERVRFHLEAEEFIEGEIPERFWCSGKERWQRLSKWAVMKKVEGRAYRVLANEEAAKAVCDREAKRTGKPCFVVFRPGEYIRCLSYCAYSGWCPGAPKDDEAGEGKNES